MIPMIHIPNLASHSSMKKEKEAKVDTAEGHEQREIKDRKAAIIDRGTREKTK